MSAHRLTSLEIIGGFLDGENFDLSDGLNCIIGARGTGKTTVLEFVRFAMDAMLGEKSAHRQIAGLVDHNLNGGRVQLKVRTKDGLSYTVSRSAGESPMVLTEDGSPTELSLKTGGLFRVDIYSQNEVENIADEAMSQLDLIDNFEASQIAEIEQRIKTVQAHLVLNSNTIIPLERAAEAFREELNTLPGVEEKLKAYGKEGGQDSEAINESHGLKALRDRESRAMVSASSLLEELSSDIDGLVGRVAQRSEAIWSNELLTSPNHELLQQALDGFWSCGTDVDALLRTAVTKLMAESNQIAARTSKLNAAHKEQELEFRELIEKHTEAQGKASARAQLEKRRNELLAKQREREELTDQLGALHDARTEMLEQMSELRDERFHLRSQIVEKINSSLAPTIRLSIVQYGNPEQYRTLLQEALKDAGVRHGQVAGKLVDAFGPAQLTEVVKQRDSQPLVDNAELNPDQAQKVLEALAGSDLMFELEATELIDLPKIELNDHGTYKETSTLSTGQKCNTILPILLMESDNPLLIDQPEDNLDNSFVYETIVASIRAVKQTRQLIFVTHNPNIPVLGEADKVFVLESDGTSARIRNEGTVDHCKDDIVTLLEGGADAFRQRKERYSL